MSSQSHGLRRFQERGVSDRASLVHAKLGRVLVLVMLLYHVAAATAASAQFHVDEATGQVRDKLGRERIFHGLNVVMKGCPWHPHVDRFDPQMSFCDTDIGLLQEWGMNVVRLAIMWPGVEPSRGQFNHTYLDIMTSIVEKLHLAGIYSLLEFHQDLFTSEFCGEGVPGWVLEGDKVHVSLAAVDAHVSQQSLAKRRLKSSTSDFVWGRHGHVPQGPTAPGESDSPSPGFWDGVSPKVRSGRNVSRRSIHYAESFPEPLGKRWPQDEFEREDSRERRSEQCSKHNWFWYYFSYAVSRAFQDLYENKWGWSDLLAQYWKVVAEAFRNQSGVLGYELMNEPWTGNFFRHPSLLLPGVADRMNLARFYDKLQHSVRTVDPDRILFIETVTFDDVTCGFSTVPGGIHFRNRTVLSYHYYSPPNLSPKQAFSERVKESKNLGCGAMLTEFFVANPGAKRDWPRFDGTYLETEDESSGSSGVKDPADEVLSATVDEVLQAADEHIQSWIGWEYKAFYIKTGSIVEQSLFNFDGQINMVLAKKLARTYPQAVCGRIISYSFDPSTSHFSLFYFAESSSACTTEIFVHRAFYYPSGLDIACNPVGCLNVTQTQRLVLLSHNPACQGLVLDVRINRSQ